VRILAGSRKRLEVDPTSFDELLAAYGSELRVRNYGASSREQAQHVLPRFFAFLKERRVGDIRATNEEHVVAWAKHLSAATNRHGEPLSPHTRRSYLVLLQRFFRFLVRRGLVLADPMLDVTMPQVPKLPRLVLSHSQARRLIESPSPFTPVGKRDRAILELLYGTGLRVAECARLELRDVDLGKGTLFVRQGKGKKDRVVPFAGQAAAALDLYLREGRPALARGARQQALFLSSNSGRPIQSTTIQLIVREHASEAGLKLKVTPHCLRHTYATHLIQGGASVRHVQKLLGHASLQSTTIYTRVFPEDLAQVVEKAHPRERPYNRRRKRASWSKE
jgi:integrase/recombinase XerD